MVACGDMSGLIKVWKVETKEEMWSFEVGDLEVTAKACNPQTGFCICKNVCLFVQKKKKKNLLFFQKSTSSPVDGVAPLRCGAAGGHRRWQCVDVEDPFRRLQNLPVFCVSGHQRQGPPRWWETFTHPNELERAWCEILSCEHVSPGKRAVVGYDDGTVRIWDLKQGNAAHVVKGELKM